MAARSASEAYRWAREVPVSIVITDVELPGDEDGRCLTRKRKGDRRIHEVPVAVLANRIIGSVRKAAGDAGCHLITARASPATVLPLVGPLMSRRRRYGQANQRDGDDEYSRSDEPRDAVMKVSRRKAADKRAKA